MLHMLENSGITNIFEHGKPEAEGQFRELNNRDHFYLHISFFFFLVARLVKCRRLEKFLIRIGDKRN
jgi:hypothetical protein